jgi:hypothetical protein
MKVRLQPWAAAISLDPVLYTTCWSQVVSASLYRNAISCWPGLHSPLADSTVIPALAMLSRMSRSSGSTRDVPITE